LVHFLNANILLCIIQEDFDLDGVPVLRTFVKLLMNSDPANFEEFDSLPEVMQILLQGPDTVDNLERLAKIKSETNTFMPAVDILLADVFRRNQLQVQFNWPESAITITGRKDYLSGANDPCSLVKDKIFEVFTPFREKEDSNHEPSWVTHVLNMVMMSIFVVFIYVLSCF